MGTPTASWEPRWCGVFTERSPGDSKIRRAPRMRFHFTVAVGLALVITAAWGQVADEYQVKAFFLYNFTRYVEWPAQRFNSPSDPLVICVLGQNPFGNALEEAVKGKAVDGRTLVVRGLSDLHPPCTCHILFVSASERKRFQAAAGVVRTAGVLTVGEAEGFVNDGGVINFKLDDGKVRFEINVEAAAQEQLHISSKLLSLARIVRK
ncbi:MAG: DUF4154 domain-containing protein [Terriglobia bacterium]|nr:MAG: DUF4154 domain-containing protein [Terriglobia bacterium]